LREVRGTVNANGLYTLERRPRPAAQAFKDLATRFGQRPLLEDFPGASLRSPPAGLRPL